LAKEPFISTLVSSRVRPAVLHRRAARQGSFLVRCLKVSPFIGLHLACIAVLFTGFTWGAVLLCAVNYFVRMFGITAVYHRYFAHKSYRTSRVFQFMLAWLGCSSVQKGPLWWASHHRRHHRYSDTPDDPHSPLMTSFWWSHIGWILSEDHEETPYNDIQDWSQYPELRWLDRWHVVPGIVLAVGCFLLGYFIGGWAGAWCYFVWGFLISTVILYHATFSINSLSHLFGRRRYATDDDSRNNLLLALITLGEGWHNNHHHYQSSANQGFFWWEIDISFSLLRVLSWFGLVWDLRRPGAKALAYRNLDLQPARQ
jgi:stearoyl-CoA desaturase (delta-9 desaturase)